MRLKELEQKELERKYGKKKAKEVAQQNFNVSYSWFYRNNEKVVSSSKAENMK